MIVFTWVRQQQLYEQCHPVLPVLWCVGVYLGKAAAAVRAVPPSPTSVLCCDSVYLGKATAPRIADPVIKLKVHIFFLAIANHAVLGICANFAKAAVETSLSLLGFSTCPARTTKVSDAALLS